MSTQYQVLTLLNEMDEKLEKVLEECDLERPQDLGLDSQSACNGVWVGLDFIAICAKDQRRFEYYGGFEYHNKKDTLVTGKYVFYFAVEDGDRVNEALSWSDAEVEDRYGNHLIDWLQGGSRI